MSRGAARAVLRLKLGDDAAFHGAVVPLVSRPRAVKIAGGWANIVDPIEPEEFPMFMLAGGAGTLDLVGLKRICPSAP
jgi:hypothetical protein